MTISISILIRLIFIKNRERFGLFSYLSQPIGDMNKIKSKKALHFDEDNKLKAAPTNAFSGTSKGGK